MFPVRTFRAAITNLLASLAGIIAIAPIYLLLANALKTQSDANSMSPEPPLNLQWSNFATVIDQGNLVTAFLNSALYAFGSTILGVLVAALAAYVLARRRNRWHQILYLSLIMGIALPTNYVTLTKVMQMTGLINTQIGMVVLYAAMQLPFNVFLIYAFIGTVPRELDEASYLDGASPIRTFRSVILPILTPVLVTCGVLNILNVWSDFINPLYFTNNSDNWPMTLSVFNFFSQGTSFTGAGGSNWALVSADVVLSILPVIIIYILAQRWILSGLGSGAVKG
jgi:raffinose/stachyose/melibiose transport system permease protein